MRDRRGRGDVVRSALCLLLIGAALGGAATVQAAPARATHGQDVFSDLRLLVSGNRQLWVDVEAGHDRVVADLDQLHADSLALLVPSRKDAATVAVKADIAKSQADCARMKARESRERAALLKVVKRVSRDPAARAQLASLIQQARQTVRQSDAVVEDGYALTRRAVAQAWSPTLPPPAPTDPNAPPTGLTG